MAKNYYQFDTNPRKIQTEEPDIKHKEKKTKIKIVKDKPKQQVKVSKEQKRKHVKLTMFAILVFTVLLAISYQNSQITAHRRVGARSRTATTSFGKGESRNPQGGHYPSGHH